MNDKEWKKYVTDHPNTGGAGWQLSAQDYLALQKPTTVDYRCVLQSKWIKVQKEKGWTLGEEWRAEQADFRSAEDIELEDEERGRKDDGSDDESDQVRLCLYLTIPRIVPIYMFLLRRVVMCVCIHYGS